MKPTLSIIAICLAAAFPALGEEYPSRLLLTGESGVAAEIPQSAEPGVYEAEITLEVPEFHIAVPAEGSDSVVAEYAPASDQLVYGGEPCPLVLTDSAPAEPFVLAGARMESDRLLSVGDEALVRIELGGDGSGTMTLIRVESEATDCRELTAAPGGAHNCFTLRGVPAARGVHGVVVELLPDGSARKILR